MPEPSRSGLPKQHAPKAAAVTLAVLVFGAGGFIALVAAANQGAEPPASASPAFTASADATAPEQVNLQVPPKEAAYVEAVRAAVSPEDLLASDDLSILNTGRTTCGLYPRTETGEVDENDFTDHGDPSSVDEFIESPPDKAAQLAVKHLCPKYLPVLKRAKSGFAEGPHDVGKDVKPGTYRTTSRVTDCYWERSTRSGQRLANDFITNAPGGVTVTIAATDGGFTSQGCGDWVRVS
jgi:hypothetical protein